LPLAPGICEADRAAHRDFVATLGDKPIWNDFFNAA
jgi:DNA polymerase-3 subunit epsilon